jgi:hypothetical protein
MKIIRTTPNPGGAYPAPQSWSGAEAPEGCAELSDDLDMTGFYEHNGFVTLEIEKGLRVEDEREPNGERVIDYVTGYTPDIEAWEAWKASLPPEMETDKDYVSESDALAILMGGAK